MRDEDGCSALAKDARYCAMLGYCKPPQHAGAATWHLERQSRWARWYMMATAHRQGIIFG